MEKLIKTLSNIDKKDIEDLIDIYNALPEGIIKDSIEIGIIFNKKMIGRIKNERNT